jgi:hypothetical protein
MGNLDIGEAMGHLDLDQKDFMTRSGSVSSNIHQVCIIITETTEEKKQHMQPSSQHIGQQTEEQ